MFSQISKSSLFNYAKRLAIVVVFTFFAASASASDYFSKMTASAYPEGAGKVYVAKPNDNNQPTDDDYKKSSSNTYKENSNTNHKYKLYAKAELGYVHEGWAESPVETVLDNSTTNPYTWNPGSSWVSSTTESSPTEKKMFAIFKERIKLPDPCEAKIKVVGGVTSPIQVTLPEIYKTSELRVSITGNDAQNSWFQLSKDNQESSYGSSLTYTSEISATGSTKDLVFYIKYVGTIENAPNVEGVKIRVEAPVEASGKYWDIPIKISAEYDTYQFLKPQILGISDYTGIDFGSYTAQLADADNTSETITNTDIPPIQLKSNGHYSVTLTADPSANYKFYGWYKITFNEDGTEKDPILVSRSNPYGPVNFNESAKIYPLYLPKDQALFIIKEDNQGKKLYYDLQEALDVASETEGYSTVVFNAPTKGTTGTLYPRKNADGTIIPYEVPAGVTLLIPGDAAYTCRKGILQNEDRVNNTVNPSAYCRLDVADGTLINVNGSIYLHSGIHTVDKENGKPSIYGHMHLGDDVCITAKSGAKIYAWGYITGNNEYFNTDGKIRDNAPKVTIEDGAYCYELFQFIDWRGGSASSKLNREKGTYKVFPIKQYYIQNIEVPMTIVHGGNLVCQTGLEASNIETIPTANLVTAGSSGAMFCLGVGTSMTRTYNVANDRITYNIKGSYDNQTKKYSTASIGSVSLSVVIATLNSSDFVLPINHNIDLIVEDVTVSTMYDLELLASATLTVGENAELRLTDKAKVYVYDADQNTINSKGYFGQQNAQLLPVLYSPSHANIKSVRGTSVSDDTRVVVNGKITIDSNASLFTTGQTQDNAMIVGGANITSDGGGIIQVNNTKLPTATLYQYYQAESKYYEIPITPAILRNSDGTYVETSKVYPGTYTYYITNESTKAGVWSLPPATIDETSWEGTSVVAYMPNSPADMFITCKVNNVGSDSYANAFTGELSNPDNFAFAVENDFAKSLEFDADNNILTVKVKYTPRNNTAEPATAELTLKNATIPTEQYTFSTKLSASEEYIPDFSLSRTDNTNYINLRTVEIGQTSSVEGDAAFTIVPTSGNVTTLSDDSRLNWSYTIKNGDGTTNDEFTYTQGTLLNGVIGSNKVTYTPTSAEDKSVTLTIIATYTPATGEAQSHSEDITLNGTSLTVNNLAFNMPEHIWVTDKNIPVKFNEGHNNTNAITVELTSNGTDELPAVELIKNDGTYSINALNAGTFALRATQDATAEIGSANIPTELIEVKKLTPEPKWNWGVVYGNQEYTLPFDPSTVIEGKWTLEKKRDDKNLLEYDADSKTLKVHNINAQSSASFVFKQNETHDYAATPEDGLPFGMTINTDPRTLPLTINDDVVFDIVEYDKSENVSSQYGMITIPANSYVVLQFIGMPGELSFSTTNGDVSNLAVEESVDAQENSWKDLTKATNEDKDTWKFSAYSPSQYVRITNEGEADITINSGLTISLYGDAAQRSFYYAKLSAIAEPQNVGSVAVKGGTHSEDQSVIDVFVNPMYLSNATGYYQYIAGVENEGIYMSFFIYAKSTMPGYYFDNWSSVGLSIAIPKTDAAGKDMNYEKWLAVENVADMYLGYGYDMYKEMYKNLHPDAFDPETDEAIIDQDIINAGALALIPATHVGTWQANFALAEVVSAENVAWDDVTSPHPTDVATHDVIFNILGDDTNDFVASIGEGKGFTFTEDNITLSTNSNTYTINVTYTPQDVHGKHTTNFTLSRVAVEGVSEESTKTITLTATEDLTPSFTLENGDFGSGTLGQATIIDITPTNKNKVAQVLDPAKLHWEASLSENEPFEIVSVGDDGTCQVRYFRTDSGDKSATLTLTATYTDSKGTEILCSKTCTLSGSSTDEKAVNTLALKQDLVLYVDDAAISPFSVNDANNTAPITITLPDGCTALQVEEGMIKPSGDFTTGDFTITVSQEANAYFQASGSLTTTVTVKKHTPEVTWNWTDLYFGQTYTTPITTNSDGDVTIAVLDNKNIVQYDAVTKTLTTDPTLTEGEFNVNFSVSIKESNTYEAYSKTHTATLYKDPRHVRVDVNEALTYRSVTIADQTGENVSFADGGIHFADAVGSAYDSRSWTMYFIGVPDQLYFTPEGNNAWEIQESPNGTNWNPTFASSQLPAGKPFSMSLLPSTRYLRISYAKTADDVVERSNGELNSFYITALEGVKANVDGLYMPIAADVTNNPTTKQVILHYTSQEDLTISTSDPLFTVDVNTLPKVEVDTYGEKTIVVTSKATDEREGRVYVKNKAGDNLLVLPIYSFTFPQRLPIQLATDDPQRFYYVTTATTNVAWDMDERIINFQNAPSNTPRSVTFAFDGAPTLMRFKHTAGERGTWTIRERENNDADWYVANAETRVVDGNEIEQGLLSTTRYVQLTYTSAYSERVDVSNLIIVGDASVTTDVTVLELTDVERTKNLTVTAFNLADFNVSVDNPNFVVGEINKTGLGASVAEVLVPITWAATTAVEYATLTITNPADNNAVLATVELIGTKQSISSPVNVGIYTGLAEEITKLNGTFEGTERRPVDLSNAFDEETRSKALFDYLFIYGETSTMDGSATIVTPNSQHGSNAKTPCYIYKRDGDSYSLYKVVDNVNSEDKAWPGYIPVEPNGISTRVYITGFAPYASTGYTKEEEGVWLFRGRAGSQLDIYLEDCYIYSRYKTVDGHSFIDRDNGESFAEQYARGSGGVLVFECADVENEDNPFEVTIHTMDSSLLKSHYGCFLSSIVGRAYQVSSPVQIHLMSVNTNTTTHLSFDDIWPKAITRTLTDGVVTHESVSIKRTNGFLSLQKQVNNAPSIDLGSPNTVVNFNGGQVELQNAQNVSDNYKTTLAISYRGGKFAGYFLAHGVGSDEVTGTVNFNDGTTTVIPMTVDERYRQYYLMDEDANGNELATTSTLRCPEHTYVYGGSHCMMRACNEPTSKGGAPLSHAGDDAVRLGLYKYPSAPYTTGEDGSAVTHAGGWELIPGANGLVQIPEEYIPNIKVGDEVARKYNVESVMPNDNGTPDNATDDYLNFWVPAGYDDSVTPEVDLKVSYWKAAMTRIKAEYASYGGSVGGDVKIGDDSDVETELVYNFLYCALDNDIKDVISKKEVINGQEVHSYAAPVKHPAAQGYLEIRPSYVSDSAVHYVKNLKPYRVQNRVYYITPIPSADNWMTFTAPFDVENLYVVETYDERTLSTMHSGNKAKIKIEQAKHNADFAAFFGVALALGSDRDFDDIYANYMGWARLQDVGKYEGTYNLRGKHAMEYYDGTNWSTANYYLYENQGTWTINADGVFTTQWTLPTVSDDILMNKGETYSLLFPYCTGCWEYDEDGNFIERTMWDYWSGKFVIFESTLRSEENPHVIDGVNTAQTYVETHTPAASEAYVLGNTSFGDLRITNEYLYQYVSKDPLYEKFNPVGNVTTAIQPTTSFLLANVTAPAGQKIAGIRRTGEIIYDDDNNGNQNGTSGHIPTVGGGNDLFITTIEEGINVAVAAPQHVRVLSSTGAVIYSGMIQTALDIPLPSVGVYVVSGENEVQKVLY